MALKFDPAIGVLAEDTSDIRNRIADRWKEIFATTGNEAELNTDPESPQGQIIDSQTALVAEKDSELLYLAQQFNPMTAEGRWQDALGKIYFLTRKNKEPTLVTCTCVGMYGTTIAKGSLARTPDGLMLSATETKMIPKEGSIDVIFKVTEAGPIEIAPHTVKTIVTVVPGWDTIDNELAGVVGRDEETRAEFEARRRESVAVNAHGTVSAIYGAVSSVQGVLACLVLENDMTSPVIKYGVKVEGHSVCIIVHGGDEAEIAEAIYLKKDAGCGTCGNTKITYVAKDFYNATYNYWILRPSPVRFRVRAQVQLTDDTSQEAVRMIKEAILDDFNGLNESSGNVRVSMAQTVYASRFYHAVTHVVGLKELVYIEVALANDSFADTVNTRGDEIPTLSLDDIEVAIVQAKTEW